MSSIFTSRRLSDDLGDLRSRLNDQYSRLDREYRFYENRYQDIRRRLFDGSPLKPSTWTSLTNDSDRFCLRLDVGHFDADDLEVKTVDNVVVIHGKHGDRTDELGVISREFTRKCTLPKDVLPESIRCSITSDGFLIVEAPKRSERASGHERVVPIKVLDTDDEGPSKTATTSATSNMTTTSTGTEARASTSSTTTTTSKSILKNGMSLGSPVGKGAISKTK